MAEFADASAAYYLSTDVFWMTMALCGTILAILMLQWWLATVGALVDDGSECGVGALVGAAVGAGAMLFSSCWRRVSSSSIFVCSAAVSESALLEEPPPSLEVSPVAPSSNAAKEAFMLAIAFSISRYRPYADLCKLSEKAKNKFGRRKRERATTAECSGEAVVP